MKWRWLNVPDKFFAPFKLSSKKGSIAIRSSTANTIHFDDYVGDVQVVPCGWYGIVKKE
jgi:hypothetical protein